MDNEILQEMSNRLNDIEILLRISLAIIAASITGIMIVLTVFVGNILEALKKEK